MNPKTLQLALYQLGYSRRLLLPIVLLAMVALTGCTEANSQIQEVGTQTMDGVATFSMFAAIAIAIYWIVFIILYGIRGAWADGYNTISQTWKGAAFLTVAAVIGLPALLGWSRQIVDDGGFEAGG